MGLKSGSKGGKGSKQGTTKTNMIKNQQQNKSTDSDDEPDIDTSILRPSIEISVSGVPQLVQAYQAATDGLRSLLASECDIIYECRVCRNLFRSVPNMISHKKIYCKTSYSYTQHTLNRNHTVEDYTVLIEPEPVPSSSQENQNWATSDQISDSPKENEISECHIIKNTPRISSFPKKSLNEIVDKLIRNGKTDKTVTTCVSASKLYENVNESISARKTGRSEHSFHLEDMETTKVGMYQTKLNASTSTEMEKEDLMKAQVFELQNMASESEAVLTPDGQIVRINGHPDNSTLPGQGQSSGHNSSTSSESDGNKNTKDEHMCPDCNVRFSTRKTLNHHMKSLHVTFRLCYPCPCCKSTFWNPWSVYRHLYKVHRKTNAQVRRLRPQIQKKAFRKEMKAEKPIAEDIAGKSETLKESQRIDLENKAWMDNFEEDLELQRCGGCGRRFERRAALNSHSQICQKRIAARNNTKTVKIIPSTSSPDKVPKPVQSECEVVEVDVNMRLSSAARSAGGTNNGSLNPAVITKNRQSSVSSWNDQSKKDVPEKKIEIQIRKDYCKMSSASSVVALSNDTQSEPDSRPPSRIGDDAESFDGEMRDWDSVIEMEDVTKEESELEYPTFDGVVDSQFDAGNESDSNDLALEMAKKCDSRVQTDSDKNSYFFQCTQNNRKRSVSCDCNEDCIYEKDAKRKKLRNDGNESNDSISGETANALSSNKCRKLEQFHPIMEARMQELINLRRLQCLPCQKKFIKLANLRRHVAVHIGWFRYKCTLCTFKCFAKYDCVDHVCRTHLKGTQRARATTLVRCIDEQEALTTESQQCFTSFSSIGDSDDSPNETPVPVPVKLDSLNIEDIKDIVGVTNKAIEEKEKEASKIVEVPATTTNLSQQTEETTDDEKPDGNKREKFIEVDALDIPEEEHIMEIEVQETAEEEKPEKEAVEREVTLGAEETVEAACEEHFEKEILSTEQSDTSKEVEKSQMLVLKQERVTPLLGSSDEEMSASEISEEIENELLNDDCSPLKITEFSENLGESEKKHEFITLDLNKEQTKNESNLSGVKQGNMSIVIAEVDEVVRDVDKNLNVLASVASDLTGDNQEAIVASFNVSEKTIQNEEVIDDSLRSIYTYSDPSLVGFSELSNFSRDTEKSSEKIPIPVKREVLTENELQSRTLEQILSVPIKTEEEEFQRDGEETFTESCGIDKGESSAIVKTEVEDSASTEEPNELSNLDEQQIALRKMVMEVIFGSGSNENSRPDTNQNLFSVPMNGNLFDSDSSDGRSSRASSTSDVDSAMYTATNDHVAPVTLAHGSTVPKVDSEHSNSMDMERRERPVRNRVKATKEDFIYDFSDAFLKKEDSNRIMNKKKHSEHVKDIVKHEHSSGVVKCVPKLFVLRTEGSELGGNKRISSSGAKGTWGSTYSRDLDCSSSNKNSLVPTVKMCSTSKKPTRMYELKP